ncbi:family 78 glycoside hydrolase catalytic domain [Seonamhaeicola maritimus]|uniref:family 78 glycoside hydrolase catalytic domain n=1 Tax=Seonamhaeicola maritimus TaxID=2591822 RepID=UPI002494DA97|nr:family 78 glycoside hydrolase catalytic domain [Seonamhaeicola maritimus]
MKNQLKKNQNKIVLRLILVVLAISMMGCEVKFKVSLADLKCEYRVNPLGIDNTKPRFSWKLVEEKQLRGQRQKAFQVLVASSLDNLNKNIGDLWDSGKVETNKSVNNVYNGNVLEATKKYFWKVKVWDVFGEESNWSDYRLFSMGLLEKADWKGDWIHKIDQKKTDHNWYRKTFNLPEKASSAYVYVGSFGYHELYVNGKKVTENVMNPVSSYMKKRIPYLTYDVTEFLNTGKNVIAIWHAAGWARWDRITEYRNPPFVFKAQAEILTGTNQLTLSTDETWKCKKSHSEYYGDWDILDFGGETIDDRKRENDWNKAEYNDSQWMHASIYNPQKLNAQLDEINDAVEVLEDQLIGKGKFKNRRYSKITAILSAQMVEPQVKYKEVTPIAIKDNNDGTYRIDMGENYTGFFEMNLYQGIEGDSILFEISDQTEKVMNWKQKSKYIYGKSGEGKFTNRFNVAGGRWITVYGLKYEPKLEDLKGYVVTNDRKIISKFESSSEQLNKIYKINLDTYIANTMDGILVDCPHRERRGWGEVTVAAMYGDALPNFESGAYMDQYLQYTRDAQLPDGQMRGVINENDRPFLMWKANSPLTVWETYKMLGDKKVLQDNYESMQKWMEWMYENSNYETGGTLKAGEQGTRAFPGLGDWCTPRGNFWSSFNSPEALHFNNCTYAYMLDNAVKMATVLGKTADVKLYSDRLNIQRKATHKLSYNAETGKYVNGQQVDQAFALLAGVTPESERKKVYDNLVDNVLYKFPYYDTGSSGQALYTRYFIESGERMDLIYELLQDKHHPSYGYFIEEGKTVWPERWSAVGVSQIHTCYTGIGGYFIKGFGGIRPSPDNPGMKDMIIKPALVGDISFANTEFESMYGDVVVNWKKQEVGAKFHIVVPINTSAKVYLPANSKEMIHESGLLAENSEGITYVGTEKNDAVGNYVVYNVDSGVYDFEVEELPKVDFPRPLGNLKNLALLGRMSASSMFIETEKLPGYEAFKANDENNETRWLAAESKNQYLEVAWVKPQTFNKIVIDEVEYQISNYKLQYFENDTWKDIVVGTTCGPNESHSFDTITSTKCRIYIVDAKKAPSIKELEIYNLK